MTDKKYRTGIGALLINEKKQIYFFQRIDYQNTWQGVEGGVDENEEADMAVYREIKEEIGVKKDDLKFIAKTNNFLKYDYAGGVNKYGNIGQQKKFYLFEFTGDETKLLQDTEGEIEFLSWKLLNKNEAIEYFPKFKKEVYKQVFKEFDRYL
ncbi:MAG: NUDIX domain-containing protein [Rickettsiales bacterium]|nr:NUDIX domain-containing protein [Rickettsiales bacterium]